MVKMLNFLLLITLSLLICVNAYAESEKRKVLLLHSYHPEMTWVKNMDKAVQDILQPDSHDIMLYTEYMDTKRHNSKSYYKMLEELYKKKYQNIDFDLILATDNNAFDFLRDKRNEIFGDVPVVFSGVNGFKQEQLKGIDKFTGAAEQFSARATLDLILKLHPNIKNIYIINDYLTTGKAWKSDMEEALKEYREKVNLIYSENLTLAELKDKIDSFESDTAILMGVYFADRDNNYITYEKIGSYLLGDSRAPVYCLLNFNISNNVIGGKVIGGYSQGKAMSEIALRVLDGENPDNIPVVFSDTNEYVFNYQGIKKYGIDEKMLPGDHRPINKPYQLYEQYKSVLFSLIMILVAVLLPLIVFFIYIKSKEHTEATYREHLVILILRFAPIVIIPLTTLAVVWLFIYTAEQNEKEVEAFERENFIHSMEMVSKREVDRFVEIVQTQLRDREANITLEMMQNHLLKIANSIKYGKSGYIIVGHMNGIMLAHTDKSYIGINILDGKHENAKDVLMKFKEVFKKGNSGFASYEWENPTTKQREQKITYVRFVPDLNWYVASGVYLDELESHLAFKRASSVKQGGQYIEMIITISVILIVLVMLLSILVSVILQKVFNNYKANILDEIEKNKEKDRLLFEQSKKAVLGDMISVIAHQLKQPLNIFALNATIIEDINETNGAENRALISDNIHAMMENVELMSNTIDDYRNFFRPDKRHGVFSVQKLIEDMIKLFRGQFTRHNITMELTLKNDIKIDNYQQELQQVLLNLINNSKDALLQNSSQDSQKRVDITLDSEADRAIITITDNGGGIAKENLEKIFDIYFTTKGQEGTGIGLNLAKMIIEESMHGKIFVESENGTTTFTIVVGNIPQQLS